VNEAMLVLFDLDDTLLDHTAAVRGAVTALHHELGLAVPLAELQARWQAAHARHYPRYLAGQSSYTAVQRARVFDVLGAHLSDAAADAVFAAYLAHYESRWALFADVAACLERLHGHRLGVISNGPSAEQRAKLRHLGIAHRFDTVVISEECRIAKPEPEIFRHACRQAAVTPEQATYVGDRYDLDALAARRAGLQGVWLDRAGEAPIDHAAPIIRSLVELPGLLGS
jgi:putative hydrolase of the HAD superfamily